jgi:hypothetical protein
MFTLVRTFLQNTRDARYGPGTLTDVIDVQGISHPNANEIAAIRALTVSERVYE